MAAPPITKAQIRETLAALKKCNGNQTHAAAALGMARATVAGRVARLKAAGMDVPRPRTSLDAKPGKAAARTAELEKELDRERAKTDTLEKEISGLRRVKKPSLSAAAKRSGKDDTVVVVFPDVHGSAQDPAAVSAFLGDLKRIGPDKVVGLGDLIDCGGFLAAHHVMGFVAETAYSYEQDIAAAGAFLDAVQSAAPSATLDLIEGNHCQRPERWAVTSALRNKVDADFLRRRVAPEELLRLKDRGARYYRRDTMYDGLPIQGSFRYGKAVFTHGIQRGGNDPSSILRRFGTNVFYGHSHKMSSHVTRTVGSGTIGAWNLGCLAKKQPLWQHGDPTDWTHGFAVVVFARSGNFQAIPVTIADGVSLLPTMSLR